MSCVAHYLPYIAVFVFDLQFQSHILLHHQRASKVDMYPQVPSMHIKKELEDTVNEETLEGQFVISGFSGSIKEDLELNIEVHQDNIFEDLFENSEWSNIKEDPELDLGVTVVDNNTDALAETPQCEPQNNKKEQSLQWDQQTRIRVIMLIEDGKCCPSEAGEKCGVPKRTARRWWNDYLESGYIGRKKGSGRPRSSSARDDQRLLDSICANPVLSCRALRDISQFPGSVKTVGRRLKVNGFNCRRPAIKPDFSTHQKIDRMAFAEEYMGCEWSRVIFSDEKIFSSVSNAPVQVYPPLGERFSPTLLIERERSGWSLVGVWGYISARGAGPLWRIDGVLSGEEYVNILDSIMKPSVEILYPEGDIYFLQNQGPIHQSRAVQNWFEGQHRFKLLPFVPRSPDLNPIENMWSEVIRSLLPRHNTSSEDLWMNIENTWWEINTQPILSRCLALSMPRRFQSVLQNEGGWVGY